MSPSKLSKIISTSTLALTLSLFLMWALSLRPVRLKIGDYHYKGGNFDQAVNWYQKVLTKQETKINLGLAGHSTYEEDLFRLESALHSLAQHQINRISNNFEADVSDFNSFDRTMTECNKIIELLENYTKQSKSNFPGSNQFGKSIDETLNAIKGKKSEICFAFGERYLRKNMWEEAKYFFTKRILSYMNPIDTLEGLHRLYENNSEIREKMWRGNIFVTLEDFEQCTKPILTHWASNTEPIVNVHTVSSGFARTGNNSEYFDLSYKKPGYDYWARPVNIPLTNPNLSLGVRFFIKSDVPSKGILKINVLYPKQMTSGVWQTDIGKGVVNGWEERRIENLYQKAQIIGFQQNLDMTDMAIERIILDTEGLSSRFNVDDIELFISRN